MNTNLLDDPNDVGMMSLGLRLLSTPGKFGQALGTAGLGAMGDMQQQKQVQAMARQRMQQEEMQRMQLEQIKRQQAEQERLRQRQMGVENAYRGAMETPAQQALAQGGGPTVGNAQAMQGMVPRINQQKLIASLMPEDPIMAAQMMTPKPEETKVVGDALVGIGAGGVKELYRAPAKPKEVNYNDLVIMGPDGKPVLNQLALDAKRAVAKAGATTIPINMGQKGFDNTLKLRGDFRSEPIYKAHQEVQSAHSQIKASLQQASPAGDLAGATKIMKILDPGSVVRESELGMAMAASGLLDRAQFYATNVLNGTKLTPTQRKDFQSLADKLHAESANLYSAKRSEYKSIAERNGLSIEDVVGPGQNDGKWSIAPVPTPAPRGK